MPLLAELRHGALYPPTWLAANGGTVLDEIAILHVWWLAVGVAALTWRLSESRFVRNEYWLQCEPAAALLDPVAALLAGALAALAGATAGAITGGWIFAAAWAPWCALNDGMVWGCSRWCSPLRRSTSETSGHSRRSIRQAGDIAVVAVSARFAECMAETRAAPPHVPRPS